ncbi:hypothetical protein GCM10023175_09730 [Pseudonocardia xishanensis]|uniref:Uncharacterized protein n=1 Tax=Pseudonocardia xishanensis TaxID=630995 RepID=A0ABP8RHE9_9PSEU
MDVQHEAEVVEGRLGEGPVAEDPGVVDQNVDATPAVECSRDHGVDPGGVGDVGRVGQSVAACCGDLRCDALGRGAIRAEAVHGAADVVDHDACAAGGEGVGVGPAEASARPGDDGDPPGEVEGLELFSVVGSTTWSGRPGVGTRSGWGACGSPTPTRASRR